MRCVVYGEGEWACYRPMKMITPRPTLISYPCPNFLHVDGRGEWVLMCCTVFDLRCSYSSPLHSTQVWRAYMGHWLREAVR